MMSNFPQTILASGVGPLKGSDERYTIIKSGPSADSWSQHRGIIIELYRTRPLEEVIKLMAREYNFCAT